jgi:hypothetical protein
MSRLARDAIPCLVLTRLRVRGVVRPADRAVTLEFPNGKSHHTKVIGLRTNPLFGHFECPHCGRLAKKLRWLDDWPEPRCQRCDGLTYAYRQTNGDRTLVIERLRDRLYGENPIAIKRDSVELSLRLAELRQREWQLRQFKRAHARALRASRRV